MLGGNGTIDSPYLISNAAQIELLANPQNDYFSKNFKLIRDIDLKDIVISPIGTAEKPFSGIFDGNYYSIKNYSLLTSKKFVESGSKIDTDQYFTFCSGLFGYVTGEIKNLTLVNANITIQSKLDASNDLKVYRYNGILAGALANEGLIENCHIKDSNMNIAINSDSLFNTNAIAVGGIVGFILKNASINSCSLEATKNASIVLTTKGIMISAVGGIVGISTSGGEAVSRCSIYGYTISNTARNSENGACAAGGLIGRADQIGKISDCMVKGTNVYATSESINARSSAGGLCGSFGINIDSSNTNSVRPNISNIYLDFELKSYIKAKIATNSPSTYSNSGYLFGVCYNSNTTQSIQKEDYSFDCSLVLLIKPSRESLNIGVINNESSDKVMDSKTNFINSVIRNRQETYWATNEQDNVRLNFRVVSDFIINTDQIKNSFFESETFAVGKIDITPIMSDGSDYEGEVNGVTIDYSGFDSNIISTQVIKISVFNIEHSYDVELREKAPTGIVVENTISKTWYQGDHFDLKDVPDEQIKVKVFYENGTTEDLDLDEVKVEVPAKLALGQNKITVKYKDLDTYFIVDAEEKNIARVVLMNKPVKTRYANNLTSVDLSGLKIKIEFTNGDSKIIAYEDEPSMFDVYYTMPSSNKIKVSIMYDGYNEVVCEKAEDVEEGQEMWNFEFDLYYTEQIEEKFGHFQSLVNKIPTIEDLKERYDTIKEASKLRRELETSMNSDEEYQTVCKKLDQEIENYNQEVAGINQEFDNALQESFSFSFGNMAKMVGSTTIVIALIVILFVL